MPALRRLDYTIIVLCLSHQNSPKLSKIQENLGLTSPMFYDGKQLSLGKIIIDCKYQIKNISHSTNESKIDSDNKWQDKSVLK